MGSLPFFTIITVFLNDSRKVHVTLDSLYQQTYKDYEHLIKDGCSRPLEIEFLRKHVIENRSKIVSSPDAGIYSGMNQALRLAKGRFVYFLNAGEAFHDKFVLEKMQSFIIDNNQSSIFYGDIIWQPKNEPSHYPEQITKPYIFKKNICHQAMFIDRERLLSIGGFREQMLLDNKFQAIQSDQETMWELIFFKGCKASKVPIKVAFFQMGGFSTSPGTFLRGWSDRAALLIKKFSLIEFVMYGSLTFLLAPLKYAILIAIGHTQTTSFSTIYKEFLQKLGLKSG
jgi:glycosyltransferase involved in cell wall biosynthesis